MFLSIKNRLYHVKSFWVTKKWLNDRPIFSFWKIFYRSSSGINKFKNDTDILLPTLKSFIIAVIYSVFIIFILELLSYYYPVDLAYQKEAVDTFLSVVASISGVFLGLYFTAISGIASSYLLRAPQNIKHFFLTEPRGQQYVRTVALTGIVSVFYIVFKSFDKQVHPAGLVFLSLLVAYIVIRFWQAGTEVFYSLEPEFALPLIIRDILFSIKSITPPRLQWSQPATQNHHRGLVAKKFDVIRNLIRFGKDEMEISDQQLIVTIRYIAGLLVSYTNSKARIPTDSYWFQTKNEFQDWALASSSELTIALSTGTPLQPKNVKDFTWYEEEILDISIQVFNKLSDTISNAQALDVFVEIAEIYADNFDIKSIELLFKKIRPVYEPIYAKKSDTSTQHLFKEQLAFVDAQGRLATSALLGLIKYLDSHSCEEVAKNIRNINWLEKKNIYLANLPSTTLSRLETLFNELKNERVIESKQITEKWYVETFYFQQYIYSLQSYFEFLKSLHTNHFQINFDSLVSAQQLPLAIHFLQRWKEFSKKYYIMVFELKKHVDCLGTFRLLGDLPWPDFDFDKEKVIAEGQEKEVTDKMVGLLPGLKTLPFRDDLPDYFGQALTEGIQACYEACKDNDPERLKKIFLPVFDATLAAYERLREKVKNWSQVDSKLIFSTEPLENIFEISGYAKLYSELYLNSEIWNTVKSCWDTYFQAIENAHKTIEFIGTVSHYRDKIFKVMPQASLRTSWQIDFENKLRENGIPVFPDSRSYDSVNGHRQPTHSSVIIRVLERSGGLRLMASARDIFFATYLSNLPSAMGISLPDKHNFKELIQEEEKNPEKEIEEDE